MLPLFNLPLNVIKNVLENWNLRNLVFLSLCSKRMKRFVRSLKRKVNRTLIQLCHGFTIVLVIGDYALFFKVLENDDSGNLDEINPCRVEVSVSTTIREFELIIPGFGAREWLDHLMYVINHQSVDLYCGERHDWKHPLESVRDVLKGIAIEELDLDVIEESFCDVLRLFPVMNNLRIGDQDNEMSPEDSQLYREVLMGNIRVVYLSSTAPFDLDMLLLSNISHINLYHPSLSNKDLNKFLRLLTKGSNPKLQILELNCVHFGIQGDPRSFDENVILKGIKYEKKPDDERRFIQLECLGGQMQINGGIDIRRSWLSLVTIVIEPERQLFNLYVWP